uniref:putative pre-16S rRNA nuclease n=1 Tax=Erigeron canadensis TaxID=72917 RepID=UPI001CB9A728|nr:putative pre-16S rRNA nuclease [Erigeron canadensis]
MAEEVSQLLGHYSIAGFAFGWPTLHGKPTSAMVHVKSFIEELSQKENVCQLPYTTWDESYSSKNVELLVKGLDFPSHVDKAIRDQFAAVRILQDYLDAMNVDEHGLPIIRDGESDCSSKESRE